MEHVFHGWLWSHAQQDFSAGRWLQSSAVLRARHSKGAGAEGINHHGWGWRAAVSLCFFSWGWPLKSLQCFYPSLLQNRNRWEGGSQEGLLWAGHPGDAPCDTVTQSWGSQLRELRVLPTASGCAGSASPPRAFEVSDGWVHPGVQLRKLSFRALFSHCWGGGAALGIIPSQI